MVDIKIKRMTLENFKCHKNLILNFEGGNISIYGDNATGKTSVYDALTWLLFGKDSHGNGEKNIEIKPLNSLGEVKDHDAITSVEAVLLVNGEEITLKRTYQEVWSTKRGSLEATFDGNTSEHYIDGVPCKKYLFSQKVNELVDEETFRMLTSVSHFADGISWQERRAVLFKVAGVMDDAQIMATDEKFKPLSDGMGRLSLDDYKKKLLSEKRGFVVTRTEIPARISECEKTIADVETIDFDAIRREVAALSTDEAATNAEIIAIEHDSASEGKRLEIREVQISLDALEAENKAYRASQSSNTVNVANLKAKLTDLTHAQAQKEGRITMYAGQITACDRDIAASRERWITVNSEKFSASNCPTCGQVLPAEQLKAAKDRFEAQKAQRLREIEQTANARKEARGQAEERIAELREELASLGEEISTLTAQIGTAEANKTPVIDLCDYESKKAELSHNIAMLQGELADIMTNKSAVKKHLTFKLTEIRSQLAKKREILSRESLLDYSRRRIEELKEDARAASIRLESIESMLFLIDEYSRYKTKFVEDSINSLFRIARFRLFREQANGGVEDRCDVVYEGVPYINVNNGAKINVGIDIINTLSRAYGVTVPLFVDNAESVTKIESSDTQIIRLVVSENDKELRVSYES